MNKISLIILIGLFIFNANCSKMESSDIYPPDCCGDICKDGQVPDSNCNCVESRMCIALACPEGQKRDFSTCQCKRTLPNPQNPNNTQKPTFCQIESCHRGYEVRNSCECQAKLLPTCLKLCPNGESVIPGTCECSARKCQIKSCIDGYCLSDDCKCVSDFKYPRYDLPNLPKPNPKPQPIPVPDVDVGSGPMPEPVPKPDVDVGSGPMPEPVPKPHINTDEDMNPNRPAIPLPNLDEDLPPMPTPSTLPELEIQPQPLPKPSSELPEPKPTSQCGISMCHNRYELDKKECSCVIPPQPICKKACLNGLTLFPPCECALAPKCSIDSCKKGFKLNLKSCECEKELISKCLIRGCKNGFRLNSNNCECEMYPYPTCRRTCGFNQQLFGPCSCQPKIECAIASCQSNCYFNRNKCMCYNSSYSYSFYGYHK